MILEANRIELANLLSKASRFVAQKSPVQALNYAKIEVAAGVPATFTVTGYDLESGLIDSIEVSSEDSVTFLADIKKLCEIVNKSNSERIAIEVGESTITVKSGKAKSKISILTADDYPAVPIIETEDDCFEIKSEVFKSMITQTEFATAINNIRPIYQGIMFDITSSSVSLVGLDGYRMALRTEQIDVGNEYNFVLKASVLKQIAKNISSDSVMFFPSKRQVVIRDNSACYFMRILDGDFMDYKKTINSEFSKSAEIDVKEMTDILERYLIIANVKMSCPIKITFDGCKIETSCKNSNGEMSDEIKTDYSDGKMTIGFNIHYLYDALIHANTEKVVLHMNNALSPIKITAVDNEKFQFLVLPVRLKND